MKRPDLMSVAGLTAWVRYLVPEAETIEVECVTAYTSHVKVGVRNHEDADTLEESIVSLTMEHLESGHAVTCTVTDYGCEPGEDFEDGTEGEGEAW